jgi:MYND finger
MITQNDHEFVKHFVDNQNEPAHFRAEAACWIGLREFIEPPTQGQGSNNMSVVAEYLRQGMDIVAASPKEDEDRIVMSGRFMNGTVMERLFNGGSSPTHPVTLKAMLDLLLSQLQEATALAEGRGIVENDQRGMQHQSEEHALLQNRANAGGKKSDCCGKTLEELQMESFMRCKRCQMVFYCSEACQRKHWKRVGHHKQSCREPGQIEVGDDMQSCREPGQIEVGDDMQLHRDDGNLVFVHVMAPAANTISASTANLWEVKLYGSGRLLSVSGDKLVRLRPPPPSVF